MLLHPSIIALNVVSFIVALLMLMASLFAIQVVRHWDITSGSELQLNMERKTYLISTLVAYCFVAELVSLLLFIYNAEQMSSQFVGAMCATGVLNVDAYGWPTLFLKIAIFFTGAAWLILNHVDQQAPDYPLVKIKYGLLLIITPLVALESLVQLKFFLDMNPDVITSCCGSLFTEEGEGVAAEVSSVEPRTAMSALYGSGLLSLLLAGLYVWRKRGGTLFALSSLAAFVIALIAIVSSIALYAYEHPHHHCPFCILKSGHDFIGYYLYIPLFTATALSLGVGTILPWRRMESLTAVIDRTGRQLVIIAASCLVLFYAIATFVVVNSNLTMQDVWW
jgi:hypothetical protein